jgi:hypothetical protein
MAQEMMERAMQTAQLQRRLIVAAGACFENTFSCFEPP